MNKKEILAKFQEHGYTEKKLKSNKYNENGVTLLLEIKEIINKDGLKMVFISPHLYPQYAHLDFESCILIRVKKIHLYCKEFREDCESIEDWVYEEEVIVPVPLSSFENTDLSTLEGVSDWLNPAKDSRYLGLCCKDDSHLIAKFSKELNTWKGRQINGKI